MRRNFLWMAVAALSGCFLAACNTLIDEKTAIDFVPLSTPAVLPGAESVGISVVAVDKRTGFKDRISTKRTAMGTQVAASNDVVELVRSAVQQELKAEGFAVGTAGITITVEVQNFYTDFPMPGLTMAAAANVSFTLRAKNADGISLYTHFYEGNGRVDPIFNESAANVKKALEQALASAVRQMVADKALQSALLSSRANSPVPRRT
jgi:uncharacterized lipoprotein YajG